jgi:uncharacterized protein (DUF697 family)
MAAKWPIHPAKIWDAWKEAALDADSGAGLVTAGDPDLIRAAGEALGVSTGGLRVWGGRDADLSAVRLAEGELLLVFVQPHAEDAAVSALRRAAGDVRALVVVDDAAAGTSEVTWYTPELLRISFADSPEGWHAVREAVVDLAEEYLVPLARAYPGLRPLAAQKLVRRTARQNGIIGATFFVPGTDMPLMTLNQVKMVLGLAAMHGEELTKERALELLSVVGVGFGLRTIARQLLDVIPGPGWVLKGGIGYSGTLAMGEAAIKYFNEGAPATPSRLLSLVRRTSA